MTRLVAWCLRRLAGGLVSLAKRLDPSLREAGRPPQAQITYLHPGDKTWLRNRT